MPLRTTWGASGRWYDDCEGDAEEDTFVRKRSRGALLSPAALAVFLHSQAAHAMEQYFCVADQATGFVWRESRWATTSFKVDDDKLVVQEIMPRKDLG